MPRMVEKLFSLGLNFREVDPDFVSFGNDIIESEELTDKIYSSLIDLMANEFHGSAGATKKDFHMSDVAIFYMVGPYIPCTKRISFSDQIDVLNDGFPGIRVCSSLIEESNEFCSVRPVTRLPNHIQLLQPCKRKYKYTGLFKSKKSDNILESITLYFGISESGKIISPLNKNAVRPDIYHAASRGYPGLTINAWADSRYLWLVETSEDVGMNFPVKLRLGLDKEHIKSLFYARNLPVTDTGRKRPILHFVKAHNRRIKDGIDIDISAHLRGISEFEMDGLRLKITQPNKKEIMKDSTSAAEVLRIYGPRGI